MVEAFDRYYAGCDRFAAQVGWKPRTPLRDGLSRTPAYYQDHGQHTR